MASPVHDTHVMTEPIFFSSSFCYISRSVCSHHYCQIHKFLILSLSWGTIQKRRRDMKTKIPTRDVYAIHLSLGPSWCPPP